MTLMLFTPDVSVGVFPHPAEFARLTRPCVVPKLAAGNLETTALLYEPEILSYELSDGETYNLGSILVRPIPRPHSIAKPQR